MPTKEQLTERIRLMTEMCRLAWLTVLAATTGTVGLLLGELSTKRLFFAVFGVVAIACFVVVIGYLIWRITATIDQLSED